MANEENPVYCIGVFHMPTGQVDFGVCSVSHLSLSEVQQVLSVAKACYFKTDKPIHHAFEITNQKLLTCHLVCDIYNFQHNGFLILL